MFFKNFNLKNYIKKQKVFDLIFFAFFIVSSLYFLLESMFSLPSKLNKEQKVVDTTNPARVFCHEMNGESFSVAKNDGSIVGLCQFRNGHVMEEWELYNKFHNEERRKEEGLYNENVVQNEQKSSSELTQEQNKDIE